MDLTKLYQKQISLTEWYEQIGYEDIEALRKEDNDKRERLEVISDLTGLPFDKPRQFPAQDIVNKTPEFLAYLTEHGRELCALRLIPTEPGLPKLRMRGHTVADVVSGWFVEQNIDAAKYKADFVPHPSDHVWSTIFVVNKNGIFGEIVAGGHNQLTQGFYDEGHPIRFSFDFDTWQLSEKDASALEELQKIARHLLLEDMVIQQNLKEKLHATFNQNYLTGYFESVTSSEFGLWFIDYNRILGKLYEDFTTDIHTADNTTAILTGQTGCTGIARGRARIITPDMIGTTQLNHDEILICEMTTPEYIPLMKQAAGIITDLGGILSHAAIVSREMNKPCLVGTAKATKILRDGEMIEMDAGKGTVRIV